MEVTTRRLMGMACTTVLAVGLFGVSMDNSHVAWAKSSAPGKAAVASVQLSKAHTLKIRAKKVNRATGYQYRVTAKGFACSKKSKKRSCRMSLKRAAGKTVGVKVRAYNGGRYGKWSRVRKVKIPKSVAIPRGQIARMTTHVLKGKRYANVTIQAKRIKGVDGYQFTIGTSTVSYGQGEHVGYLYDSKRLQDNRAPLKNSKSWKYDFKNLECDVEHAAQVRLWKKQGNKKVYGAWSKVKWIRTPEDPGPIYPDKLKYHYSVKFINQPTTGSGGLEPASVYLKTDNPNDETYRIELVDSKGERHGCLDSCPYQTVVDSPTNSTRLSKDEYLTTMKANKPGRMTVQIVECKADAPLDITAKKSIGTVIVRDRKKLEDKWMDAVIHDCGADDESLSKPERMSKIQYWLAAHSCYSIHTADGKYAGYITRQGLVKWDLYQRGLDFPTNSYESPSLLVAFGKKIGYPLESQYGKYKYGTDEWYMTHFLAKSVEDGSVYSFCPQSSTGEVDPAKVEKFNPATYSDWYEMEPLE